MATFGTHKETGEKYVSSTHTHVWRKAQKIRVGDRVHRWGDDLEVLKVVEVGDEVSITFRETDGSQKKFKRKSEDELIIKL